jgi:hypothetical protein
MTNREIIKISSRKVRGLFYSEMYGRVMFNFGLSGLKSFFRAITDTAWGITGFLGLGIALRYMTEKYNQEYPYNLDKTILSLNVFTIDKMLLFFLVLWIYSWILSYRSLKLT